MNFVTLFRPLRVVPNSLEPSLDGLDWGAMSKMFSGCLSPASTPGCLVSVMAPPCPLTCHPSVTSLPGPSTKYDTTMISATGKEHEDTAYSNLIGPFDAADQWGEKGSMKEKMEVLRAWMGAGRRKRLGSTRQRVDEDPDEVMGKNMDEHEMAGPTRFISSSGVTLRDPKRYGRNDDSGDSSDEGGSDGHARTAWKLFGVGEMPDACKIWVSPSSQTQSQVRLEAVVDIGTLPTPTSSPLLCERRLARSNKGKERAIEHSLQSDLPLTTPIKPSLGRTLTEIALPSVAPDPPLLTSFVSACTSPFVSFEEVRFSGEEHTNEAVGSGSQPFALLGNVVLSDPSQEPVSSPHPMQHGNQLSPRQHRRNPSVTRDVANVGTKRDMKNVGASSLKRRRLDVDGSAVKIGEKDGASEPAGGKLPQSERRLTSSGRVEGCELQRKSFTGLTRTPTVPAVASKEGKETSPSAIYSAFEVEDVLGAVSQGSAAPAVTAASTIPFPVRKHIGHRVNDAGKTGSLSTSSPSRKGARQGLGLGLASCSTSAIVCAPMLAVKRTSTIARARTLSAQTSAIACDVATRTTDVPVSPQTVARRAKRAERKRITEKLRLARPDLVRAQSSRGESKTRLSERGATSLVAVSTSTNILTSVSAYGMDMGKREASDNDTMDVTGEDAKIDWERSRRLAGRVREALKRGQHVVEVLPRLRCLEQWYADRA